MNDNNLITIEQVYEWWNKNVSDTDEYALSMLEEQYKKLCTIREDIHTWSTDNIKFDLKFETTHRNLVLTILTQKEGVIAIPYSAYLTDENKIEINEIHTN